MQSISAVEYRLTKSNSISLDFELPSSDMLTPILEYLKDCFPSQTADQDIFKELLHLALTSIYATNPAVSAFYAKLIIQHAYVTSRKTTYYLTELSIRLQEYSHDPNYYFLLAQICNFICKLMPELPEDWEWIKSINAEEYIPPVVRKVKRQPSKLEPLLATKIYQVLLEKNYIDLNEFKTKHLLREKNYFAKFFLIFSIVIESKCEFTLNAFCKSCGKEPFKYILNRNIANEPINLFVNLLNAKELKLAYVVLKYAVLNQVYFENPDMNKIQEDIKTINSFCEDPKTKFTNFFIPVARRISNPVFFSSPSSSRHNVSSLWSRYSYILFKQEKFHSNQHPISTCFNIDKELYPYIIEVNKYEANATIKVHLFPHNLKPEATLLTNHYNCVAVLSNLKEKLIDLDPACQQSILSNPCNCQIKENPGIDGATLEIKGSIGEIENIEKLLRYPHLQLEASLEVPLEDIKKYVKNDAISTFTEEKSIAKETKNNDTFGGTIDLLSYRKMRHQAKEKTYSHTAEGIGNPNSCPLL